MNIIEILTISLLSLVDLQRAITRADFITFCQYDTNSCKRELFFLSNILLCSLYDHQAK